jgi:hypothetical protein
MGSLLSQPSMVTEDESPMNDAGNGGDALQDLPCMVTTHRFSTSAVGMERRTVRPPPDSRTGLTLRMA